MTEEPGGGRSASFTPGPWKAVASMDTPGFWAVESEIGDIGYFSLRPDDVEANVHLIAAAPELYAAVERAIWLIEDAEKDTNWCAGDPYSEEGPVKDFRALLAIAQGQSHDL